MTFAPDWFDSIREYLDPDRFMPHGACYQWRPELVWTHAVSDLLIGVAYFAISIALSALVRRIRLPFSPIILAFGAFIFACGCTHFIEVWTIWRPYYGLAGVVKVITAVASVATALFLFEVWPRVVSLAQSTRLSEQRREQLERAHVELERLYARLKEADEQKTRFFANVSHELRTPLTLLLGPVERLRSDAALAPGTRGELDLVERNARLLLKHVNDLLDVSKLAAGQMEARYADVDLAVLVRATAAHFGSLAAERQLAFAVRAPGSLLAQVDPEKLQQVLLNLLANAFKFVPDSGQVVCVLEEQDGQARLAVRDSGPGVPPALREAVFERFKQGEDGATRRFGGTGLGLAIAKDFVQLHRGRLTVGEAPEGGASFEVEVPLRAPEGSVARGQALPASGDDALRGTLAALRPGAPMVTAVPRLSPQVPLALVVEDNPELRGFIARGLAEEFAVELAADGEEGLRRALALRPDLIITDVMMPRMSGDQLVEAVRREWTLDAVPILVLTARTDDVLKVKLLREGAQDFLVKPFSEPELLARARNLASLKRARERLEREVSLKGASLEVLADELGGRKRELQTALETARVARAQAEQANAVKSSFLSMVTHELRTPLTSLQLNLQSLLRDGEQPLSERQHGRVERSLQSMRRLTSLVDSLLDYARVESGRLVVQVEPFSLERLAAGVLEELRPSAQLKQLQLVMEDGEALAPLCSDPRLVRLVMANLVSNAIKYTAAGEVRVRLARQAGGRHVLQVKDTGPGIPREELDRIFEPFHLLEPLANKSTPGMGLGLALVRELASALGGEVGIQSEPGQGSTFEVSLPDLTSLAAAPEAG